MNILEEKAKLETLRGNLLLAYDYYLELTRYIESIEQECIGEDITLYDLNYAISNYNQIKSEQLPYKRTTQIISTLGVGGLSALLAILVFKNGDASKLIYGLSGGIVGSIAFLLTGAHEVTGKHLMEQNEVYYNSLVGEHSKQGIINIRELAIRELSKLLKSNSNNEIYLERMIEEIYKKFTLLAQELTETEKKCKMVDKYIKCLKK